MPFFFPLSQLPSYHYMPPNTSKSSQYNMTPTFQVNNFKPWAPPRRKPFSPHRSPYPRSERTSDSPYPRPCHESLPSTLPFPKHHLPVRPPAEVCMNSSTNTRPCAPGEIPAEPPSTISLKKAKHGTTPPRKIAPQTPHASTPDTASHCDSRENTGTPTELPCFPRGITEAVLPSPSISTLDDGLEEIFRLPDTQSTTPIDPAILADDGPWEGSGQCQPVPGCDGAIVSETICPYPEPPPVLHDVAWSRRDYNDNVDSRNDGTQTNDHSHTHGQQELRPFNHNTEPNPSHSNNVSEPSTTSKRKRQRSNRQALKRPRVSDKQRTREDSFTVLRSHFLSLPLDGRLQFLSWLFEGVLSGCMLDSVPTCGKEDAQSACRSALSAEGEQKQRDTSEAHGTSRKGEPWTTKEADLLLKLRNDEKRSWSEVTRLFSDQYPGRSQGSIQVYWSTTLKKRIG
jgi:hypothetical protein